MRIAIVGPGALGTVFGALLAKKAACGVSLVGRTPRPPAQVRLERVGDDGGAVAWDAPAALEQIPVDTQIAIVCTRYEQLSAAPQRMVGSRAPVVVMTPMLPEDHARLSAALPERVRAGMPGVVSYRNEAGVVRFWLPRSATTRVQSSTPGGVEADLVAGLRRAGIRAEIDTRVLERNVATTVSFLPLALALDIAGGVDALLADEALLRVAFAAAGQGLALGRMVGKPEAWAPMLLHLAGVRTLPLWIALARARSPEAVRYVEEHFGRKLHSQNVAMAQAVVELAKRMGAPAGALEALRERLGSPS